MTKTSLVAAIRDEELSIESFLASFESLRKDQKKKGGIQLILIEDGSSDNTNLKIINSKNNLGVILLTAKKSFGQGWAISLCRKYARQSDFLIMMDADSSHPLEIVPTIIELLEKGEMVVQCLKVKAENRLRNRLATAFGRLCEMLFRIPFKNQNTFYRGLRLDALRELSERRPSFWWFLRFSEREWKKLQPCVLSFKPRERMLGSSKYNLVRLFKFAITGFLATVELRMIIFYILILYTISFMLLNNVYVLVVTVSVGIFVVFLINRFQQTDMMLNQETELLFRGPETH
jgi:glycosyltransferase involved in cell wall biosynthesis